ncbi:MAG: hypothetical protein Roseis2KO_18550 [Roseivirga sp.]
MIVFLIKMTVCMLLLMGIYQLLLAKTAMHKFKRFYLLFGLILPIIIPFVELESKDPNASVIAMNENLTAKLLPVVAAEAQRPKGAEAEVIPTAPAALIEVTSAASGSDTQWWLTALYGIVALALLIRYSMSIYAILKKSKTSTNITFQGSRVNILEQTVVPHNFLNLIFISRNDYEDSAMCKRLLAHELSHARQLHTVDILLLELLRILFWFNPLYIFWSRAMRINHEYLADAAVLNQFNDVNTYKNLLLSFVGHKTPGPRLASPSNYSLTKKRFIMMTKKISKMNSFLRLAILTPLLVLTAVAMTLKTSAPEVTEESATLTPQQTHPSFEGAKPSIFPIDEKYNPEFLLHFDATMHRGTDREYNHQGVDYRAAAGTAVRATADGTVVTSEKNDNRGNHVIIKHSDEYQTLYASLDELRIEVGEQVKRGMTIGTVGKSIENSNVHLHYEVIKNGKRIDPKEYYLLKKTAVFLRDIHRISLGVQGMMIAREHGLDKPVRSAHFPKDWQYTSIVYNRNKVLFIKEGTEEVKTINMSDLSEAQKEGLRGLKSDIRSLPKTPLKDEIIREWTDADKYLVIIDGELKENDKLTDFDSENVAYYWREKLRKNDPEKPLYRIEILSEDGYRQLMKREEASIMELEKANRALLDIIID